MRERSDITLSTSARAAVEADGACGRARLAPRRSSGHSALAMLGVYAVAMMAVAAAAAAPADPAAGPGVPAVADAATPALKDSEVVNNTLPAQRYFMGKIFDKYGDKGIISFEVSLLPTSPLVSQSDFL